MKSHLSKTFKPSVHSSRESYLKCLSTDCTFCYRKKLELLHELYGTVFIPPAVYDEGAVGQHKQRVIIDDFKKSWLKVKPVQSKVIVDTLKIELDAGEAEVIALAIDEKADLILIDERIGRRTAERLGVLFLGTLGILTQAKQKNLIPTLKPIYMTPKLIAQLLSTVGET